MQAKIVWEQIQSNNFLRWVCSLPCRKPLFMVFCLVLFVVWSLSLSDTSIYKNINIGDSAKSLETMGMISKTEQTDNQLTYVDISKPYDADFKCVYMQTVPKTPICLHDILRDEFISHDLETTGLWEPRVLQDFIEVLLRDPAIGVVDLGANIGVYTLVSARMGHRVVAVEPFTENTWRIHKAALLGETSSRIVLLHNAVSDRRVMATIQHHGTNQGDVRITHGASRCIGSCPQTVKTILLDDLLKVTTFNRSVIKVDTQGFEHRIFMRAERFLSSVLVPYIFMEWQLMKKHFVASNHTSEDKQLVQTMVDFLMLKRYRPYKLSVSGAHALVPSLWHQWPDDVIWRRLPTDIEYQKLLRNHFLVWP